MRLTRNELAAAIRAARRYPKGNGYFWGWKGELRALNTLDFAQPIPSNWEGG